MSNPILNDIKAKFKSNNPVTLLIIINIAVFLFISIIRIFAFLSGESSIMKSVEELLLKNITSPLNVEIIYKPWTVITYMFSHYDFLHIFWNMISLYWFGQILLSYTNSKKIIPLYILGGITGAVFVYLLVSFVPALSGLKENRLIGASAGVTAIIVGAATLVPHVRLNLLFIGPVKLMYVAIFAIFIDVLNVASYSNIPGNLAHIGGAIMGFIFISQHKKGRDLGKFINRFFDWIKNIFSKNKSPKMKVVYKKPVSDEDFNYQRNIRQQEIDAILDKISKSGYDSLSKKEKEILFNASKQK